jgi:CheY-like chemotaxis protein
MQPSLLVVDDEETTRRLVAFTLRPLSVRVIEAVDVQSALTLVRTDPPDMILVDINLPGIDGFMLMDWLRDTPKAQDIPFVAFTARSNPDDELRAYELGAVGFLSKPFSMTELRALVSRFISS